MDLAMDGQRVIVTAGASGIGRVTAEAFLAEGARVAVCDVDEDALAALRAAVPACHVFVADVADREAVDRFVDDAVVALGGLDTLVNNAGIAGPTGRVEEIGPEDWDQCLAVCLTGQFNLARRTVPHLRQSENGSIINLSSMAGKFGFARRSPYAAAKWGVIGFTKSLAIELGPDGIRVNAIQPGLVAGERIRRVLESKAQELGQSFVETEAQALAYTSLRSYVTPRQIADQILFLASTRGRTISGQAIAVCADTQMLA